jgi:hypothetical protein
VVVALEGKIIDFGVADILQLISQQQKTGVLLVEREGESIEVLFWNGMIVSAHPVAKADTELLGERLVKSGYVTDGQLQQALAMQSKNRQHIGEVLVDMNIINRDMFERIIHNQIYDTFTDLFQWKEGSYVFRPASVNFNERLFTPLGFEHIILDVLRMMDEWPLLLKSISSLDAVFKRTAHAEGADGFDVEASLLHDQRIMLNLVDGRMSVAGLAERSMMGKFATVQALRTLLDRELIERVERENRVAGTARSWQQFLGNRLFAAGWYALFVMLTVGLYRIAAPDVSATIRELSPGGLFRVAAATVEPSKKFKIKNALQVYYWEQGRYPATLEALVESGLLQKAETEDSAGNPFSYRSHKRTYTLP